MRDSTRRPPESDEPDLPPNIFVVGLLHQLKAGGYSWTAWGTFWRDSWVRSVQILDEHPELRASWLRFALGGMAAIVAAAVLVLRYATLTETLLFLVTSLVWWGVLMTDLALHLGLMVNLETGELERGIGWPNRLTELRGFASIWVAWGAHWVTAGTYVPLLLTFGGAAVSDLLDGWLARRRHHPTRWGRLYDPFMDGIFFSTASIALAVVDIIPDWLAVLVTVRYAFPVVGAIAFLVVRRRTLRVRHTPWGRASSASIAVMVFASAAASVFHLPFTVAGPILFGLVCLTTVGAFITILLKGIEQA
ncbi:MAG TPA: CDP-alcohol phosphatidyltransferase family protein [Candidatus Limnocylindrales bacterium]|nr:CDP-alcohol phosphatidyltransferase family protein [Candidatus Limnocylindrales bacterium]